MKKITLSISVILLILLSWLFLIRNVYADKSNIKEKMEKADFLFEKTYYYDAYLIYKDLLEKSKDVDLLIKYADCLDKLSLDDEYIDFIISCEKNNPNNIKLLERMFNYYIEKGEYKILIKEIESREKCELLAEFISKYKKILYAKYELLYYSFDDLIAFNDDYIIYRENKGLTMVEIASSYSSLSDYDCLSFFSKTIPSVAAVKKGDEFYYIDQKHHKRIYLQDKYDYLGEFSDNNYAVFSRDDKYGFINIDGKENHETYQYCLPFNNERSTFIKTDGKWRMIDNHLNYIGNMKFLDVYVDDFNRSIYNNRGFVSNNDKYALITDTGQLLTDYIYDDVDLFYDENGYAAVQIADKFYFINADGETIKEQKADDIKSYSCNLAAIKIDGYWGYINKDEELVIEPKFDEVYSFNRNGETIVMNEGRYNLLKLIYVDKNHIKIEK